MKPGSTIQSIAIFCLTAVVLTGCNQKPTESKDTSITNNPPSVVIAGSPTSNSAYAAAAANLPPLRTILSLKQAPTAEGNTRVRIQGTVLDEQPGEFIVVYDGTGTVFAETHQTTLPSVKELVDLSGRPVSDGYSVSLKDTVASSLTAGSSSNSETAAPALKPAQLPLLTKIWEIRDLSTEKAAWKYPVQLRAVVTVNAHHKNFFCAQDDSAGITIWMPDNPTNLSPGDVVDIAGVSDPGGYSPIVLGTNVTVVGKTSLPEARPETLYQLATGQDDSQWIEVRGVVRSMSYNNTNGFARLLLNDPSGVMVVNVPAAEAPVNLLDASVRIRGACGSLANDQRQSTGFEMWASDLDEVHVEEPGATDPLSRPAQPIASLGQFHPRQTLQHRINLAGVVTYADADFFFIQDANTGVRVEAPVNDALKPGDYVMASGYPGLGNYGFLLSDAVFKIISHRPIPTPRLLLPETPLNPQLHDLWVQIKARFLRHSKIGAVDVLTLQTGNRIFDARFTHPVSARINNLESGSLLEVTGIYRVLSDEARVPKSFQLAVPSEDDVRILEKPSWWTIRHTVVICGGMGTVIAATILWVWLLRRKVQQQTASLKQSEQKFRSLVEQSLVGVYIVQDYQFVYVNPRMAAIFGYTPEEMIRSGPMEDLVYDEDRPLVREQIRRRIAGEINLAHYFFRGRRRDGASIHVEVLGTRTEYAGQPAVLGTLLDVNDRKLAEDKIAAQARMLDLASDAIMVCNLEDRIRFWNQNAQQIYGWTAPQAVGFLAWEKLYIAPADYQKAKATLLQDQQWHGEFTHRDHHGREITVAARWTLVRDSQGKPDSILTINSDVTQQKQLEAELLRTQRLDSIGVLAGGIAHDLNNVLAPILMSAQLLEMDPATPSESRDLISTILASTERATGLVKQILTFARGTGGRRQSVQPSQVLEELRKILGETFPKSIALRLVSSPEIRPIHAEVTQVHQVLMNLCVNARDAMPTGGELTVAVAEVELTQPSPVLGGLSKPGSYVAFSVTDTGTGMPPEVRERIFDPFFTTKAVGKGTGLGLSTALGIVKSHGGFIDVQSAPGRGSVFKVYLPAHTASPLAAATPRPDTSRFHGHNELILVAEDEAALRNTTRQTLIVFGYRVVTADNGREALTCYQRQKDEIALVLSDMMMPVMDGPAAIQALAQINPEIKIIGVSGQTRESQIVNPVVRAFLTKPYTAERLLQTVHDVLHAKPAGPQQIS